MIYKKIFIRHMFVNISKKDKNMKQNVYYCMNNYYSYYNYQHY